MDDRPRDAVVVGSGPNGLAAAAVLAAAGKSVTVLEAQPTFGGGTRSAALTLPGFVHDVCSAVHPMLAASPFFRDLGAERLGIELIHSPAPLAHPLDDGTAVVMERSVADTAAGLGADGPAYERLMDRLVRDLDRLLPTFLGPPRPPRHPLAAARFGLHAVRSTTGVARSLFGHERAPALLGGLAAHSALPLTGPASAAFGLVLGVIGHARGWPVVEGGSQRIADALAHRIRELGGELHADTPVTSLDDLPPARAVLLDLTPRQIAALAAGRLPSRERRRLLRYRYGPGVFKLDWALDREIPWTAPGCRRAATVHLGGTLPELAASEAATWRHEAPRRPYVLLAQPSLFDPSRAPGGKHTAWAYCHVPNGWDDDMTERIEDQVERFAPGFRDAILARSARGPAEVERHNANCVGGDIGGGSVELRQLFTRPVPRVVPYATRIPDVYVCSSAAPPGPGVHGMCGYHAARAALRRSF